VAANLIPLAIGLVALSLTSVANLSALTHDRPSVALAAAVLRLVTFWVLGHPSSAAGEAGAPAWPCWAPWSRRLGSSPGACDGWWVFVAPMGSSGGTGSDVSALTLLRSSPAIDAGPVRNLRGVLWRSTALAWLGHPG